MPTPVPPPVLDNIWEKMYIITIYNMYMYIYSYNYFYVLILPEPTMVYKFEKVSK